MKLSRVVGGVGLAVGVVAARDLMQKKHALMRNYPVIAHARYWLETIGPELRQYIVTGQRRGAAVQPRPALLDLRLVEAGEQLLRLRHRQRHRAHAGLRDHQAPHVRRLAAARPRREGRPAQRQGARWSARGRAKAFRPDSLINISGMSFGSMSGNAIQALNSGAKLAGCMHNTGEGGLSPHHRQGGDIVLQIGTAYFGCRDEDGTFSLDRAQGGRRLGSRAGDRGQALAGREARVSVACCRPRR